MKWKWWRVVLWVAFVLMVLCAIRDVRRPAASRGAPRPEIGAGGAPADEKQIGAQLKKATERIDENAARAATNSNEGDAEPSEKHDG